jgi:undecaprenyl-diphosphatase
VTVHPETRQTELRRELLLVRRLLIAALVATLAALPFLALLLLVRTGYAPLATLDAEVATGLNRWASERPGVVSLLEVLASVTSPWTFRLLVLVAAAVLWRRGRHRLATWAVVTMAVGGALGVVLKLVVDRARPELDDPVSSAVGLSFPSGHALNSLLGSAVLLLVVLPVLGRRGRVVAWAVAVVAVLMTGFDRVGLGVHFISDVVAGWALALAVLLGTVTAFGTWRRRHPR